MDKTDSQVINQTLQDMATKHANIAWLKQRLRDVQAFIRRDREELEKTGKMSTRISLDSWLSHERELQERLKEVRGEKSDPV